MFYIGFLIKKMSISLIPSFLVSNVSESLRSLTKNEQCEQIAQVAHQKWVTMSDLLRSLTKNERIAHLLILSQKTSDSLRKLMSEFSALAVVNDNVVKVSTDNDIQI